MCIRDRHRRENPRPCTAGIPRLQPHPVERFPVPANGTQKLRLIYEHLLPAEGEHIDYILPRTEAIDYAVPWNVTVGIESKREISTVYSPSHKVEMERV